jgi:hypothetical protein
MEAFTKRVAGYILAKATKDFYFLIKQEGGSIQEICQKKGM